MSDHRQQDMTPDDVRRELQERVAHDAPPPVVADPPPYWAPGHKPDALKTAAELALERLEPVEPPYDQVAVDRMNYAAEWWRRFFKAQLERLPRPPQPAEMADASPAADAQANDLLIPGLAASSEAPPYRELARLRGLAADVAGANLKAQESLAVAKTAYDRAVSGGTDGGGLFRAKSALAAAQATAASAAEWATEFAQNLPAAEEAARADRLARLLELARAESEAAAVQEAQLLREAAESVAAKLPAIARLQRLRAQLTPAAVKARFARELSELS
jgi:hypothetical protein